MNKFNKGKLIGVVAASLSAVSLMGVGFASWIINGATPASVDNINVEVGTVDDQRIKVVLAEQPITGNLNFDAASDQTGNIKSGTGAESLSFSVNYTVEVANSALNFKVDAMWRPSTQMNSFLDRSYITSPFRSSTGDINLEVAGKEAKGTAGSTNASSHVTTTGFHTDAPRVSTQDGVTTYTCITTFYFGWGSAFDSKNPVYEGGSLGVDGIVNALKDLQALKNEKFTITLTPSVVTGK